MIETDTYLPIKAAPYQHQIEAVEFALRRLRDGGGAALLMEMGTGKTLTTIAIAGKLLLQQRIRRLLVVAPLSIRWPASPLWAAITASSPMTSP